VFFNKFFLRKISFAFSVNPSMEDLPDIDAGQNKDGVLQIFILFQIFFLSPELFRFINLNKSPLRAKNIYMLHEYNKME